MINHLSIKDFAVIENTSVDFNSGLNIITGETGAGKSVVIEGISLALGARADSSFIRTGSNKAVVQLAGDLDGEEVVITREITANGKNICKLNGQLITLSELKETCYKLADIHGQYDNQFLLNPDNHINFLDQYGKTDINPLKEDVQKKYLEYSSISNQLNQLIKNQRDMKQKLDFYQFQLNEIDNLNLYIGEDEQLEAEINLLENSEKIYGSLDNAYVNTYSGATSALDSLYSSMKSLEEIQNFSKEIEEISQGFSEAYYNLQDLQNTIRSLRDSISFSPADLDLAISRMEVIKEAKRKYGNTIKEILDYREEINEALGDSIDFDHKMDSLSAEQKVALEKLLDSCNKLTSCRKKWAANLESEISNQLKELNFNNSQIEIVFKGLDKPTENGMETVEIFISTNTGEMVKPLAKVASGGEISRIMLAFKKIVSATDKIPTLIFDEIDNGISGITASIVAKKLKEIAAGHQVICITHLPQIAASGDTNYRIVKDEDNEHTYTTIETLSNDEKVKEVARLLGGTNITEITLASAKELISTSI